MNQYAFSGHWAPSGVNPQAAGERIEALRLLHGTATVPPAVIVEDARPETSVLHNGFTWDQDLAAQKCREQEARMLVNTIRIVAVNHVPCAPRHAFINVIVGIERGYVGYVEVLSDDVLREQVLGKAKADLRAWRQRYADLRELAELFTAIDIVTGSTQPASDPMAAQGN